MKGDNLYLVFSGIGTALLAAGVVMIGVGDASFFLGATCVGGGAANLAFAYYVATKSPDCPPRILAVDAGVVFVLGAWLLFAHNERVRLVGALVGAGALVLFVATARIRRGK